MRSLATRSACLCSGFVVPLNLVSISWKIEPVLSDMLLLLPSMLLMNPTALVIASATSRWRLETSCIFTCIASPGLNSPRAIEITFFAISSLCALRPSMPSFLISASAVPNEPGGEENLSASRLNCSLPTTFTRVRCGFEACFAGSSCFGAAVAVFSTAGLAAGCCRIVSCPAFSGTCG